MNEWRKENGEQGAEKSQLRKLRKKEKTNDVGLLVGGFSLTARELVYLMRRGKALDQLVDASDEYEVLFEGVLLAAAANATPRLFPRQVAHYIVVDFNINHLPFCSKIKKRVILLVKSTSSS